MVFMHSSDIHSRRLRCTPFRDHEYQPMGHRLSKIYTRTGDDGTTGLGDGARIQEDSLRARGITATTGPFEPGELVLLESPSGPLGQGLIAYSAADLARIVGLHSDEFEARLGYPGRGPVVHRDDLILFER